MKLPRLVCFAFMVCIATSSWSHAGGKKKKGPPQFPLKDSPARDTAEKYGFSMNMLLFPDYFMTDEQFEATSKTGFNDSNMLQIVRGLNAYGSKVAPPKSADDYRTKIYPEMLSFLRKSGYVAIEVPVNGAKVEMCKPLKALLAKHNFRVTAVGNCGEDLEESLKARVDAAHALGATVMAGPIVLQFKQFPEDKHGDVRVRWVNEKLKELSGPARRAAEYAKSKNVRLAVEPLNRFELPGLNRLQDAIKFTRLVNHPNFGVMIDTCHEMSDGDGPGVFSRQVKTLINMEKLFHVHISAIHRGRIDRGWINWWGFFRPLMKHGYKGNMSMEIFDAAEPFASAVNINRKRFANPMAVSLSALLFSAKRLQQLEKQK